MSDTVIKCKACGRENDADLNFCVYCGQQLNAAAALTTPNKYCPSCGTAADSDDSFCVKCGSILAKADYTEAVKEPHKTSEEKYTAPTGESAIKSTMRKTSSASSTETAEEKPNKYLHTPSDI